MAKEPQASRPSASSPYGKCDARAETTLPEEYKVRFESLARGLHGVTPAEMMRELMCTWVLGQLGKTGQIVPPPLRGE